jgi:phage terminase small subunit
MRQRGRKSAAALAVVDVTGQPPRLEPPESLSDAERAVFIDIAGSVGRRHFQPSDMPLLVAYVRAILMEQEASHELSDNGAVHGGKASPWLVVLEKAQRAMVALSGRLRLSPQARSPSAIAKEAPPGRRPWD